MEDMQKVSFIPLLKFALYTEYRVGLEAEELKEINVITIKTKELFL